MNAVAVSPGEAETEIYSHGRYDEISPMAGQGNNRSADIVGLVKFLASEKANWIHGQVLRAREDLM